MAEQREEQAVEAGGCLCGNIRYTFPRAAALSAHHCHCTDCQKSTGSGKATIIFLPADALELRGEYQTFTVTGSEGSRVTRGFCPKCGCPILSYVRELPDLKFIKAGSLDDPSWVGISSSYWEQSAHAWSPVDASLPSYPANPVAD